MVQTVSRPQVSLYPHKKEITFNNPLSFEDIKGELKLLKKSYKDIYEWKIIINGSRISYFSSSSGSTYMGTTTNDGIYFNNGASSIPGNNGTIEIAKGPDFEN